jgi:hypothetical protein
MMNLFNFKLTSSHLLLFVLLAFTPVLFMPLNSAFAAPPNYIISDSTTILDTDLGTSTIIIPDAVIGLQNDRLLVVGVSLDHQFGPGPTVLSVTFGPSGASCTANQSFTQVPSSTSQVPTKIRNELFSLTAPSDTQTCDIVITLSSDVGDTDFIYAFATYSLFSEVNQAIPIDNAVTATGNSAAPSVTISNTADHFVFDVMSSVSDELLPAAGANQIARETFSNNFSFLAGISTQLGNLDSIMDWSFAPASSADWAISAITIRSNTFVSLSSDGGGNGCSDCIPPTLGLDSTGRRIVSNGFSYNDIPVNVNSYYTAFPLIQVNVGEENKAVLQIYDNSGSQNIAHVALGFGLGEGESFNNARAVINLDRINGKEVVTTFDPENVLNNTRVVTKEAKCTDIESQCLFVTIYHTFRDSLNFNMVSTNIWDVKRNSWQNYFNHGVQIEGDSLNSPKTKMIAFGETQMRGLHTLTQINKIDDLWSDEIGNIYHRTGNDNFDRIFSNFTYNTLNLETAHGCDRNCSLFSNYKTQQEDIAQEKLGQYPEKDAKINTYINELGIRMTEFNSLSNSENVELQNRISNEIIRAQDTYEKLFNSLYKNRIID